MFRSSSRLAQLRRPTLKPYPKRLRPHRARLKAWRPRKVYGDGFHVLTACDWCEDRHATMTRHGRAPICAHCNEEQEELERWEQ